MTKNSSGFIVHFDEDQRAELIRPSVDRVVADFSDALSVPDLAIGHTCIALLAFSESTIDYLALAKKGQRVASYKSKIEFSNLVNADSLPVGSIENRLGHAIKPHFIKASRGIGGRIPEKTWLAVLAAIRQERPGLSAEIDRLISLSQYSGYRLTGPVAEILLLEREAVGTALDVFSGNNKLRDTVLRSWAPPQQDLSDVDDASQTAVLRSTPEGSISFLSGIAGRSVQEESAIQHDLFNWEGLTPAHSAGNSSFEQGPRRLDIVYANRNSLEHTLGVDLIYYVEQYDAFVLVQYKLMTKEGYRPDAQLRKEIDRMDSVRKRWEGEDGGVQTHNDFRLNDDGFMFKLVPNAGLRPASGELIKGMYLPRLYMHFLLGPFGPKGERGGTLINFENAPRYLTNTEFAQAVHSGWIGTRQHQSTDLKKVVREYYETGHALLVGYERSVNEPKVADTPEQESSWNRG